MREIITKPNILDTPATTLLAMGAVAAALSLTNTSPAIAEIPHAETADLSRAPKPVHDPEYGYGLQQSKAYPFGGTQTLTYYLNAGRVTCDVKSPLESRRPPALRVYGQWDGDGKPFPYAFKEVSLNNTKLANGGWEVQAESLVNASRIHKLARKHNVWVTCKSPRGYITMPVRFKN